MAAMPIYGKILKNLLLHNKKASRLNLGILHSVPKVCQVLFFFSNDDRRLTFDLFTARSSLYSHTFNMETMLKKKNIFSICIKD